MSQAQPQNYANHARMVPAFHFVALPILAINLFWSVGQVVTAGLSFETLLAVGVALALIVIALCARLFALWAQDRVIRLEMRLKLTEVLSDELKPRIGDCRHRNLWDCVLPVTPSCRVSCARCSRVA